MGVRDNLTDPKMIIGKYFKAAFLLDLMMYCNGSPADESLLVAPSECDRTCAGFRRLANRSLSMKPSIRSISGLSSFAYPRYSSNRPSFGWTPNITENMSGPLAKR